MHIWQKTIKNISNNDRGFTLIEVMIALVVFAIGLLAVASMQISSIGGNSTAREVTDASALAASQVEILMGLPYNDPLLNDVPPLPPPVVSGNYQITWTVVANAPTQRTKTVTINVVNQITNRTVSVVSVIPEIL